MRPRPAADWLPLLQEALAREGRARLPLRGDSMLPTLPLACEIEVAPLGREPRPGELLVFALGAGLVAHRLTAQRGAAWIAQGDNRRAPDPPLPRDQVLGRVVAAFDGERQVWPRRGERIRATRWVGRARLWQAARRLLRRRV
jgi:hypothetical protein